MIAQFEHNTGQSGMLELSQLAQRDEREISLALYLRQYHGWSRWMLNLDGTYARIGKHRGRWCLEPHRPLFRWLTRYRLPLDHAFPPELRIRFLPSLKWRNSGSSLSEAVCVLILCGIARMFGPRYRVSELLDNPVLYGAVEDSNPPRPSASFPVGEWMKIRTLTDNVMSMWLEDTGKTRWKLSAFALCHVVEIEVDAASISAALENVRKPPFNRLHT